VSTTEILAVKQFSRDVENVSAFCIDRPSPGTSSNVYDFDCAGWVLAQQGRFLGIELVANDGPVRRIPIIVARPDVLQRYPASAQDDVVGFWSPVSVLGMTQEFELRVEAVLDNQMRIPLGQIQGRHRLLPKNAAPYMQPLILTSMGRTGTTWLMRLLAEHPGIVAYREYPYEMRAGRYWMQVLGAITEPAAHAESPSKLGNLDSLWWVAHHPFSKASNRTHPRLREWFGRRFVEQVAPLCQWSIEDCYREVAAIQAQAVPVYFAEKHLPDEIPGMLWEIYPNPKEIFLVRDFRDMLCSIRAFNTKRGTAGFGRNNAASEEEYIVNLGREAERLLKSWQNRGPKSCLVRYEDLMLEPIDQLSSILKYLGLESSDATIQDMIRKASVDSLELEQHRTSSEPGKSVARWLTDLDSTSLQICEQVFGTMLKEFGYGADECKKPSIRWN
jgi:hypothetical protein